MPKVLRFRHLLTADGLRADRQVTVDDGGVITAVEAADGNAFDGDLALPGMVNAHSHCFQLALRGFAEGSRDLDSFWSWRELMYRVAGALTPDELHVIARQAFAEMLCGGYTSVGEFHYLHHLPDGSRGPQMAQAVIAAAADAGIRLALLPVYYERGGFGAPPSAAQARFVHESPAAFGRLLEQLGGDFAGIAPHSLRAVPLPRLAELVAIARELRSGPLPVHLHIAEQRREVDECIAATGERPVARLLRHVAVDRDWQLVHATHADAAELAAAARAGAGIVVCPLTEANLGDGVVDAREFRRHGGRVAIGSDGNTRIDAIEELRWLEYGQRLAHEARGCLADADPGAALWARTAAAGAEALGLAAGVVEPGRYADLVVLDRDRAPLGGLAPARALDALLVGGDGRSIAAVYVGGRRVEATGAPEQVAAVVARLLGRAA